MAAEQPHEAIDLGMCKGVQVLPTDPCQVDIVVLLDEFRTLLLGQAHVLFI
jgi:hypothetical protein